MKRDDAGAWHAYTVCKAQLQMSQLGRRPWDLRAANAEGPRPAVTTSSSNVGTCLPSPRLALSPAHRERPRRPVRRGSSSMACTSRWRQPGSIPAETHGIITPFMLLYALHDATGEADAGPAAGAMPRAILVGRRRRPELRVRPAQGCAVPQWRAGHRGGCEVLVRALPRRGARPAEGARRRRSMRSIRSMSASG